MWDDIIEKIIDAKIKASQQPSSDSGKIDAQYSLGARFIKTKEKLVDNKDFTKFSQSFLA